MQRFPQPQFETGHVVPVAGHPSVLELLPAWADAAVLVAALLLMTWAVLARRSRRLTWTISLLCLLWFGFGRHGCICPVGATQNVAVAAASGGGMPWLVGLFFAVPLLTALLFGRIFCAAVCPLGALQDLAVIKPVRVPRPLDAVLRVGPLLVLAAAVLLAANDAAFPVCTTDPFVGFFRRSAPLHMLLIGGAVLLLGTVVARPYCRYYCPYGVLLAWCARFAWKHARVTPDKCIQCRLCAPVCPFDAIDAPRAAMPPRAAPAARRTLLAMLLLAPLLVAAGAWAGRAATPALAAMHPDVMCQNHLARTAADPEERYLDAEAFRARGGDERQLAADADAVRARFLFGASVAGALIGLVLAWRLVALARRPERTDYEINRSLCLDCARCFAVCPQDEVWRKQGGRLRGIVWRRSDGSG